MLVEPRERFKHCRAEETQEHISTALSVLEAFETYFSPFFSRALMSFAEPCRFTPIPYL